MLRSMLFTAVAASALAAAPAALAQTNPQPPAQQPAPAPPAQQAAAPAARSAAESGTVIDVLRARGEFTTLLAALDRAGLTETLASRPAISIFAPTDAAFAALPEEERTRLLDPANAAELRERLLYHVIVADVASGQIEGTRGGVQTAAQTEVQLDGTGDGIKVDNATVVQADIGAGNGAIFAIDQVLDPARSLAAMGDSETAAADGAAAETPAEAPADEAAAEEAAPNTPPTLPAERTAPDPAPTTAPSPATADPAPAAPTAPDTAPAPGSAAAAPAPTGVTATTTPATGQTAPNGQPAATVTTVQSPPVQNPTDGQVDDEEDPLNPAPTPDE